ncbi:MAG: NifU N-terminal domain-containing protein [Actinomycetota bacterium]|nr:NifU N-terminal domain-containing protein [Actinomycetota bacterium]
MGQLITVTPKKSTKPGVLVFELNRSLTGMGHERYRTADVTGNRPVDELARRLFAAGGVQGVHVYSNVVTVQLSPMGAGEGLADVIRDLFTYYREGVEVADPMAGSTG